MYSECSYGDVQDIGKEFYDAFVSRYKTLLMELEPLVTVRAYEDAYQIVKGDD